MSVFNSTVHILHVGCQTSTVPWLAMLHRLKEDNSETRTQFRVSMIQVFQWYPCFTALHVAQHCKMEGTQVEIP